MLDSPASSEGSSPSRSPTVRTDTMAAGAAWGKRTSRRPAVSRRVSVTNALTCIFHQPDQPCTRLVSLQDSIKPMTTARSSQRTATGRRGSPWCPKNPYIQDTSAYRLLQQINQTVPSFSTTPRRRMFVEQENSANASTHSLPYSDASKAVGFHASRTGDPFANRAVLNPLGESSSPAQSKAASLPLYLSRNRQHHSRHLARQHSQVVYATPHGDARQVVALVTCRQLLSSIVFFLRQWQSPSSKQVRRARQPMSILP